MKGLPEELAGVQRMRVIAAECRAAATRIRLASNPAFCYTVILNEAQRHEALVDGSGLLPAFEAYAPDDDRRKIDTQDELPILARIITPTSTSTHVRMIRICAPMRQQNEEVHNQFLFRQIWNLRAERDQLIELAKRRREMESQMGGAPLTEEEVQEIERGTPGRVSTELDIQTLDGPDFPKFVVAREADAALACGLVSEALVTMAEYLDFLVHSPELIRQRGNVRLSVDAWDVLAMLWKLKAFGERRARSLKQAALEDMPKRKNSRKPSTIEKAAQMGFKELKSAGLALARPNVGSWLTPEGRELAQSRWGSRSTK
jgi:hypothetical protein